MNVLMMAPSETGHRTPHTLIPPRSSPGKPVGIAQPAPLRNGETSPPQRTAVLSRQLVGASLGHPVLRGLLPVNAGFVQSTRYLRARLTQVDAAIFLYCTKGNGWCEVEGRRHEIRPGDLVVIPPRVPHAYGAVKGRSWTISWVQVLGTNLEFFLAELGLTARSPVLSLGEDPRLVALFHEVLEALEGGRCSSAGLWYASQTLAHLIGAMIWRRCEKGRSEPDVWRKIEQSMTYMQQNLAKPLHVATLAALASMSPSHYTALFKRRTGSAPIDYFIRLRMQHARHLLTATSLCVKEVAAALGYDDPFYFSRVFKSVNEVAPSDYRRSANIDRPAK